MTRDAIRDTLETRLACCASVLALWEAGSVAFDRADRYSDLDLGILYETGAHDDVWSVVDQAFDEIGGVDLRWNEPSRRSSSAGTKRIFRPKRADQWLRVDIHIFPDTAVDLQNQPERHGRIVILFDQTGRLASPPRFDEEANCFRTCAALHQALMKWQLHYGWFRKELTRRRNVDAFMMHFDATLMPLLIALNIRYRPQRWDFGLRYLKEDLPLEVVRIVERMCYVPNPAGLEERFAAADQLLQTTVKELEEMGIIPIDPEGLDISAQISDLSGE